MLIATIRYLCVSNQTLYANHVYVLGIKFLSPNHFVVQILKKSVNIVMTVVIELIVCVCLTVLALYTLLSFNCPSPNPLFISEVLKLREL
jgi:hypothetical protein